MLSLAALVYAEASLGVAEPAAVLFLGLVATFGLLALVRVGGRRMRWPLVRAAFPGLFGALFLIGRPDLILGGPPVAHAP